MGVLGYLMGVLGYLMGVLRYLMGGLGYPMAWRRRQAMAKWRWGRRKWRGAPIPGPVQVRATFIGDLAVTNSVTWLVPPVATQGKHLIFQLLYFI